jgi:hypothetical protein
VACSTTSRLNAKENVELKDIKPMIQDLYELKHNGEYLKNIVNCKKKAVAQIFKEKRYDVNQNLNNNNLRDKFKNWFSFQLHWT